MELESDASQIMNANVFSDLVLLIAAWLTLTRKTALTALCLAHSPLLDQVATCSAKPQTAVTTSSSYILSPLDFKSEQGSGFFYNTLYEKTSAEISQQPGAPRLQGGVRFIPRSPGTNDDQISDCIMHSIT